MKVRVYKTSDGEVVIFSPSARYQSHLEDCKHPYRFRNGEPFTMEVMELADVQALAINNEAGSAQFYYEGSTLKHDNDRSELLMGIEEIKTKHRTRLTRKLDEELAKATPDPVALARLQRDREKVREMTDQQTYAQALANLDEDGLQKPKIRAKLSSKIAGEK